MPKFAICEALFRKKTFDGNCFMTSELRRCLSVVDVMFLAVGQMIGAGIFVLTGSVVRNQAGPSIIISFLFAGFAALLSAFSYAEFGARFPRAGSAYTYAYVGIGEIWGFMIGWTILLEYMIGNAAVARSWSGYFDTLIEHRVRNFTLEHIGSLDQIGGFFSHYPDLLAFLLIVLVAVAVSLGSKISATVNTIFVYLNLSVLAFIIVCGFTYADLSLWVGENEKGISRFFPFGFGGTLAGAATCFFSFIGFEALATAGEEAKKPQRTIPIATFGSLALVTFVYVLMSATLTLMLPYDQVDANAAFADAFQVKGAPIAKYVITIGALAGMINNLVTGAFALPRAVYAMADDGLIFAFFAKVNKITKVPLNAIIVFTLLNAILAAIFDLEALVEFLSIGTLMAYSFVSSCVIILRYQPAQLENDTKHLDEGGQVIEWAPFRSFFDRFKSDHLIAIAVILMIAGDFWLAITFRTGFYNSIPGYCSITISAILIILSFFFIVMHKQNSVNLAFKVPFVPFIPCLGLFVNIFMMTYLNPLTWVRLFVWMSIGLLIYFGYGYSHSKEGKKRRQIEDSSNVLRVINKS